MEQLSAYELLTLIKLWSTGFQPNQEIADRLLQLATAFKARVAAEAVK